MLDGRRRCSRGGIGRGRRASGAAVGVEEAHAIKKQRGRIGGERGGQRVRSLGLGCAGSDGEPTDRDAGRGARRGMDFAADLGRDRAFDFKVIGCARRGGPAKRDRVAEAMGGEILNDTWKMQRRRLGRAGTGTTDGEGQP